MPVKKEPPLSEEVMAIMGLALEHPEPVEALEDICIDDACPERTLNIGSSIAPKLRGFFSIYLKSLKMRSLIVLRRCLGLMQRYPSSS